MGVSRSRLVVAVVMVAGTAGAVEVTSHTGEGGRGLVGPPLPVARSARAVRVKRVEVVGQPVAAVRIHLSGRADLHARTLRADGAAAPRIYVDLAGSALDPAVPRTIAGVDPIVRVRTGQFDPSTARIIIDLARETPFEVAGDGPTATITIGAPAARKPATRAKPVARKPPAAKVSEPAARAVVEPAPEPVVAEPPPPAAPAARLTPMGGVAFAWPVLDGPPYDDPEAEPFRRAVAAWQAGTPPAVVPPAGRPTAPAALYLVADTTFLQAVAGHESLLAAAAAYEHALREAPDFPDAARGHFMLGQADLALGFGPEAGAAFVALERRFPESPYLADALLGQAASLRLRQRVAEARGMVDRAVAVASGDAVCRARLAQAADAATPGAAIDGYRRLADACPTALDDPSILRAYAETLVRVDQRAAAWRLLQTPHETTGGDDEGRVRLLAGGVAPDPESARAEYERVLGLKVSPEIGLEAEMRLALLDAADAPEKAAATLVALAARPAPPPARATVLAEAAQATAAAGRFEDALVLLDRGDALGPAGVAASEGPRRAILARWIGTLASRGDDAGIATVYAAYTTVLQELAAPEDRLVVARALARLGLHAPAARLLERAAVRPSDPEEAVTFAEESLAAGDVGIVRQMPAKVRRLHLTGRLASRLHAAVARAALVADDVDAATLEASATDDLGARADVARALLGRPGGAAAARALLEPLLASVPEPPVAALVVAGAAALDEQAWDAASAAYGRALDRAAPGAERAEAAAGLVRAARERGDVAAAAAALAQVAEAGGVDRRVLARLSGATGRDDRGR